MIYVEFNFEYAPLSFTMTAMMSIILCCVIKLLAQVDVLSTIYFVILTFIGTFIFEENEHAHILSIIQTSIFKIDTFIHF